MAAGFPDEVKHLKETIAFIDAEVKAIDRWMQSPPTTADKALRQVLAQAQATRRSDLSLSRSEPYFGRVDFRHQDGRLIEAYVGMRGIHSRSIESSTAYAYDWRAPFPGKVYYADPTKEV